MKSRDSSLSMAIVARLGENRWLYLLYGVDKYMLQLDRIHVPTRKDQGRCRVWIICNSALMIQRVERPAPCSFGFIIDLMIMHSNVLRPVCINSEREDPGKEDGYEQALVDDHSW